MILFIRRNVQEREREKDIIIMCKSNIVGQEREDSKYHF